MSGNILIMAIALVSGPRLEPADVLDGFITAVATADTAAALDLLSPVAFETVGRMIERDPALLCRLASGFGVQLQPSDIEGMDGRGFVAVLVSSPALSGMVAFAGYDIGPVEIDGSTARVGLEYSILGSSDTISVAMVREDGRWLIADYFGTAGGGI